MLTVCVIMSLSVYLHHKRTHRKAMLWGTRPIRSCLRSEDWKELIHGLQSPKTETTLWYCEEFHSKTLERTENTTFVWGFILSFLPSDAFFEPGPNFSQSKAKFLVQISWLDSVVIKPTKTQTVSWSTRVRSGPVCPEMDAIDFQLPQIFSALNQRGFESKRQVAKSSATLMRDQSDVSHVQITERKAGEEHRWVCWRTFRRAQPGSAARRCKI